MAARHVPVLQIKIGCNHRDPGREHPFQGFKELLRVPGKRLERIHIKQAQFPFPDQPQYPEQTRSEFWIEPALDLPDKRWNIMICFYFRREIQLMWGRLQNRIKGGFQLFPPS